MDRLNSPDLLIWTENAAAKFTVKTAYRLALCLNKQPWAEHSLSRAYKPVWRGIWALNIPPKVRTFLWRACSNCLPTRENLYRRVQVDTRCDICHHQSENTSHILWECPFAQNVWALMSSRIQKCRNMADDFFQLFRQLRDRLTQGELEQWAIWNARNRFYFEHVQLQPKGIVDVACRLLEEYQRLMALQ